MAQLKDTIIQGDARVTDTLYASDIQTVSLHPMSLTTPKIEMPITIGDPASSITSGINFTNETDIQGHIGIATTTILDQSMIGIYSTGKIAIRPNAELNNNKLGSSYGITISSTAITPESSNLNTSMALGSSSYKWTDFYATLISPDKVRINTTTTSQNENLYVNGSARFYLGTSSAVADKNFTIAAGASGSVYSLSIAAQGIQEYDNSSAPAVLYIQPKGGDLVFGQASSVSTTAYSFKPNQDNKHNLGVSNAKWANVYATNLYGAIDTQVPTYSGSTAKTHYLTFITDSVAGQYQQYVSPFMKIYETPSSGAVIKTNLVLGRAQTTSLSGVVGGITLYSGNEYYGHLKTPANLSANINYTLPNAEGTIALTSDITTQLSTWAGSSNITTIGTLSNGTVPWVRLSNIPDAATNTKGVIQIGAGLSVSSGTVSVAYGTTATTACVGNDSRLSDARTPLAHTHGAIGNDGVLRNTTTQEILANRVPYTDSNGFLTTTSNLTYSSNTLYSKTINISYHSSTAQNQAAGLNLVNGSTILGHIGASAGGLGLYHDSGIYLRPSLSSSTQGLFISAASIAPTTDGATLMTTDAMSLGESNKRWTNVYATLIQPTTGTYTTSTNAGIVFYNSTTLYGHIGAATSGQTTGSIGLQTIGQIVFRAGATLSDSGALDGDSGINFSSTGFIPKTNAAALNTTGALTLGSSTAQWSTTYTKQLTVDQHVTLVYNSSDLSLNFNFS